MIVQHGDNSPRLIKWNEKQREDICLKVLTWSEFDGETYDQFEQRCQHALEEKIDASFS